MSNNNELNLREITKTLSVMKQKDEPTKEEEEFIKYLEQKRDNILGNVL